MLEPVLRLLHNYVSDPRFGELVCDLAGIVIGMDIRVRESWSPLTPRFRYVLSSDRPIAADRYPFPKTAHKTQSRVEVPKGIGAVTRSSGDGDGYVYTAASLKRSSFASYFVHVKFNSLHANSFFPTLVCAATDEVFPIINTFIMSQKHVADIAL